MDKMKKPNFRRPSGMFANCLAEYIVRYQVPSLVAQSVNSLPAMQETWVRFQGWEDPLEKEMATHSSVLTLRTPWREEPSTWSCKESDMTEQLTHIRMAKILNTDNTKC